MSRIRYPEICRLPTRAAATSSEYMEQLRRMDDYKHVISVDESSRKLVIYRKYENGKTELYTEVNLPDQATMDRKSGLSEFARLLGENILMDSPVARRLLGL